MLGRHPMGESSIQLSYGQRPCRLSSSDFLRNITCNNEDVQSAVSFGGQFCLYGQLVRGHS